MEDLTSIGINEETEGHYLKKLSEEEISKLKKQENRLVTQFQQNKLEAEAAKNWDKFYKRNETRFFKDRHWTTREFEELIGSGEGGRRVLLEVGCGVGNFAFPLLEEDLDLFIYACDFSPRAVQFVKDHKTYDETNIKAFVADITKDELSSEVGAESVDILSVIFVLSAIHPDKFKSAVTNIYRCLRPGGIVLVRDYGLYDMAMIRFAPGAKMADKLYVRQDGTRSYYFSEEEMGNLFKSCGFEIVSNNYVSRQTVNKKEGIDAQRIFIQSKFIKPKK